MIDLSDEMNLMNDTNGNKYDHEILPNSLRLQVYQL